MSCASPGPAEHQPSLPPGVARILDAAFSSLFDPHPIIFRPADDRGVRPVREACAGHSEIGAALKRPLNRNAFLCGCLVFTETETTEHLIVGFGRRHGTTTLVEAIAHLVGEAGHVQVPAGTWGAIRAWVVGTTRGEVLVVHNHPRSWIHTFFDPLPIASAADRDTMLRTLLEGGGVQFYVAENGFVRRFRTPRLLDFLNRFRAACKATRTS